MLTVVETLLFQRQWPLYWTEEERGAFAAYIAEHPTAGDVVPESGGIRKVRWHRAGLGKSGVADPTRTPDDDPVLGTCPVTSADRHTASDPQPGAEPMISNDRRLSGGVHPHQHEQ